jgi:hypothetical protein
MTFEDARAALFRAPHAEFVTERKRLAAELKAAGDKEGSTVLQKLGRPAVSAWAVNQLWWLERTTFEQLLASAAQVRGGNLAALPAHKADLQHLLTKAKDVLVASGNAAHDATLRRVETSLATLAANGGFEPDAPGALTNDREPSGFATLGIPLTADSSAPVAAPSTLAPKVQSEVQDKVEHAQRELTEAAARARATIDAHARHRAEPARVPTAGAALETELEAARERAKEVASALEAAARHAELELAQAEVRRFELELQRLTTQLEAARARVKELS